VSPLTLAPDAVRIDTTGMPVDAVVQSVIALINRKLKIED
jgi:cytidylate kinase